MKNRSEKQEEEPSSTGVFELIGEPAIVINGVPSAPSDSSPIFCDRSSSVESTRKRGFGEWLEGREVRKLFGEQFYSGKVTYFDRETGWYRVIYEDGDFEDLNWRELEQVLLPLDITIPLKALALKIIKKRQKPIISTGKKRTQVEGKQAETVESKGKMVVTFEEV